MVFQQVNLLQFDLCSRLSHLNFWMPKNGKNMTKFLLSCTVILASFLSKNVKVLRSTGSKLRKNSARVDFGTFQDELKIKFVSKIQLKLG